MLPKLFASKPRLTTRIMNPRKKFLVVFSVPEIIEIIPRPNDSCILVVDLDLLGLYFASMFGCNVLVLKNIREKKWKQFSNTQLSNSFFNTP